MHLHLYFIQTASTFPKIFNPFTIEIRFFKINPQSKFSSRFIRPNCRFDFGAAWRIVRNLQFANCIRVSHFATTYTTKCTPSRALHISTSGLHISDEPSLQRSPTFVSVKSPIRFLVYRFWRVRYSSIRMLRFLMSARSKDFGALEDSDHAQPLCDPTTFFLFPLNCHLKYDPIQYYVIRILFINDL